MQNNICLHRDRDIKNKIRINKKAVAYMRQPEIYLKILIHLRPQNLKSFLLIPLSLMVENLTL